MGWPTSVSFPPHNSEFIDLSNLDYPASVGGYPDGSSPSSGFAAVMHFLAKGYQVQTSGFDLRSKRTSALHDWSFETESIAQLTKAGFVTRKYGMRELREDLLGFPERFSS